MAFKELLKLGMMDYTYNSNYMESRDWEDSGLRPVGHKVSEIPFQ
jgi:hypothetical protein